LLVLHWYSFRGQNSLGYPLDSIGRAIFSGMAIDIHGQFGRSVAGESLRFFDGEAAFDYQVDISFADSVKVYLAARSLFRYTQLRQIVGRPLDQLSAVDLEDLWTGLSAQVHREGMLSLNEYSDSVEDPFLGLALQLAVYGTESALIRDMQETRLDYAILPHQKTRGMMVIEGIMALLSGDNPLIVRHKLTMFVAQPSPDWDEPDLSEVNAELLLTQLQQKPACEMTLENMVDFYALMAQLVRNEGTDVLKPLREELLKERDLTTELMRRSLDMIFDKAEPDQIMKALETQL